MSQVLKDKIIQHIEKQGALTVSEYMDFCLWDLDYGYYSARDQFSQCQDFVTSPEISSLFGMTLGRWIITQKSIHKAPIIIVELGGGSGHLAVDILDTLLPNYCDSIKEYAIIEKSPKLRGHQKKTLQNYSKVAWYSTLQELQNCIQENPIVCIANEFFDAFPINQYIYKDSSCNQQEGWYLRKITALQNNLAFTMTSSYLKPSFLMDSKVQPYQDAVHEESLSAHSFFSSLISILRQTKGSLVMLDYGEYMGFGDTLQAQKAHKWQCVFETPGEADLTSHVRFYPYMLCLKENGIKNINFTTQTQFLLQNGILDIYKYYRSFEDFPEKTIDKVLTKLIGSSKECGGMGHLFKTLTAQFL